MTKLESKVVYGGSTSTLEINQINIFAI